jgi:hypothetical protein
MGWKRRLAESSKNVDLMNGKILSNEDELLAALHDSEAEARRKAAKELGVLACSDCLKVIALLDVMQNDCEGKVREMAYWALSSPANQEILSQHPDWQSEVNPLKRQARKKLTRWLDFLKRFTEKIK